MKKVLISFSALMMLSLLVFVSQTGCTKETINTVTKTDTVYKCTPSIVGLWTGAQQNATSGQPFNMSIKADGSVTYENIVSGTQQFCSGTWTLSSGVFTCNTVCIYGFPAYVGIKQRFTANFNSTTGILSSGLWANTSINTDNGTFTLTKAN